MWTEAHKSGKVNFVERYRDPYTNGWKRTYVLMERDTPRIRKEAQKILDAKIADILSKLKSSEMLFTDLFDQWWTFLPARDKTLLYSLSERQYKRY